MEKATNMCEALLIEDSLAAWYYAYHLSYGKIYVAKESFNSTDDTPGYISFEVRPSPPHPSQ